MNQEILFLLPGQGSHYLGMGKDLLDRNDTYFNELIDGASDFLGTNLKPFISGETSEGFTLAANLQPMITAITLGYCNLLKNEGLEPTAVMGHSLGEISSLAPAGVVTAAEAVELAAFRGQLMDYSAGLCGGGVMAVVLFSTEEDVKNAIVEFGLEETLFIANYNAPNQTVISGLTESVKIFDEKFCAERRAKVQKIDVAGPWHTPYIEPGREKFLEWVTKKEFSKPQKKFILNGTADFADPSDDLRMRIADQLVKPVYWTKSLTKAVEKFGENSFVVEVGPGKILTGLLRANKLHKKFGGIDVVNAVNTVSPVTKIVTKWLETRS